MMKKPLSVSSPTHALAIGVYFILGFSGFVGVFRMAQESSIIKAMGPGVSDTWSTTLMIAGWGALASAFAAKKARRPEHNLKLEMLFALALGLNLSFFMGVVVANFGIRGFSTLVFAGAFAAGAIGRSIQIFLDLRLIKRARAHPEPADPVMADPRDDTEG